MAATTCSVASRPAPVPTGKFQVLTVISYKICNWASSACYGWMFNQKLSLKDRMLSSILETYCWKSIWVMELNSSKKVRTHKFHQSYFSYYHTSNIVVDIITKPVCMSLNWYHICNGYEIMESTLQLVLIESQKWNLAKYCVLAIVQTHWRMKTIKEFPCWATLMNCKISFLTFTHI